MSTFNQLPLGQQALMPYKEQIVIGKSKQTQIISDSVEDFNEIY